MLQRVPPDMRILTPGFLFFSSRSVRLPRSAARITAISQAAPAPMTITSQGGSDTSYPQDFRLQIADCRFELAICNLKSAICNSLLTDARLGRRFGIDLFEGLGDGL